MAHLAMLGFPHAADRYTVTDTGDMELTAAYAGAPALDSLTKRSKHFE